MKVSQHLDVIDTRIREGKLSWFGSCGTEASL